MAEPTIPEMVRVGLEFLQEMWEAPKERFQLIWPDGLESQGLCIRQLADLVGSPDCPWNVRVWAFDALETAAAQYRNNNDLDSIPPEMALWAMRVASKEVERPRRPLGRDGEKNLVRDLAIAKLVAMLRHDQGYTYERSIELVAEGAGITTEAVRTVLQRKKDLGKL